MAQLRLSSEQQAMFDTVDGVALRVGGFQRATRADQRGSPGWERGGKSGDGLAEHGGGLRVGWHGGFRRHLRRVVSPGS